MINMLYFLQNVNLFNEIFILLVPKKYQKTNYSCKYTIIMAHDIEKQILNALMLLQHVKKAVRT